MTTTSFARRGHRRNGAFIATSCARDGATVGPRPMSQWTEVELVQAMVARNLESFYPWEPRAYGEVVLDVRDLASASLLRHASFSVRAGEIAVSRASRAPDARSC